MLHYGRRRRNI